MTFRLTKPEPTEAQVLDSILSLLKVHKRVGKFWRQNTGAGQMLRAGKLSQFVRFGFPGSPDIHGYLKDGRALYIEVKRPSGVVSKEQQEFIDQAKANGCVAFIARGVSDVVRELEAA